MLRQAAQPGGPRREGPSREGRRNNRSQHRAVSAHMSRLRRVLWPFRHDGHTKNGCCRAWVWRRPSTSMLLRRLRVFDFRVRLPPLAGGTVSSTTAPGVSPTSYCPTSDSPSVGRHARNVIFTARVKKSLRIAPTVEAFLACVGTKSRDGQSKLFFHRDRVEGKKRPL